MREHKSNMGVVALRGNYSVDKPDGSHGRKAESCRPPKGGEMILKGTDEEILGLENLFVEALTTDGGHHKQWYLEKIAKLLGIEIEDFKYEKGIAP